MKRSCTETVWSPAPAKVGQLQSPDKDPSSERLLQGQPQSAGKSGAFATRPRASQPFHHQLDELDSLTVSVLVTPWERAVIRLA